jgi:hypothetical protein
MTFDLNACDMFQRYVLLLVTSFFASVKKLCDFFTGIFFLQAFQPFFTGKEEGHFGPIRFVRTVSFFSAKFDFRHNGFESQSSLMEEQHL